MRASQIKTDNPPHKSQLDCKHTTNVMPDGTKNYFEPQALHAEEYSNDMLCYGQGMKAHDSEDFKTAMRKEINVSKEEDAFELIPISEKPKHRKLIHFAWTFKRKISPLGMLIKHKARL